MHFIGSHKRMFVMSCLVELGILINICIFFVVFDPVMFLLNKIEKMESPFIF